MAESNAPIVVGIRHTSSATSTMIVCARAAVVGERLQRHHRDQEDQRESGEQDVERDLVRRLLALGALDEADHPVEEGLARLGGDLDRDLVGEHARSAGHGRAVAARLPDDRRRLAGDRRLVDAGDAVDDGAVARDDLARDDDHHVTHREVGARDVVDACRRRKRRWATVSWRAARSVSACALPRPSATASAKLANSTVNHSHAATSPRTRSRCATTCRSRGRTGTS